MERVLTLIDFAILIIALCFEASLVWERKSKGTIPSKVAKMVLAALLFALEIPRLVLEVSLGEEYAITIIMLVLCALNVFLCVHYWKKDGRRKSYRISCYKV